MIAMPLMVSTISTGHIFYIIEGFNLEILVWIFGEILETFIYWGAGNFRELSGSRQVIQHYIPCHSD